MTGCPSKQQWAESITRLILQFIHWLKVLTKSHATYTHTFNGPLSGTTRVNWYQKGKTSLILLKQETVSGKSAPRSRQITTPAPHHSVFYWLDVLPAAQPTASKHGKWLIQLLQIKYRYQMLFSNMHYSRNNLILPATICQVTCKDRTTASHTTD